MAPRAAGLKCTANAGSARRRDDQRHRWVTVHTCHSKPNLPNPPGVTTPVRNAQPTTSNSIQLNKCNPQLKNDQKDKMQNMNDCPEACTLLYQVLQLVMQKDGRVNRTTMTQNYKTIMKMIHTDKDQNPEALMASQCVTTAYRLLQDNDCYEAYVRAGKAGIEQLMYTYNSGEFTRAIVYIYNKINLYPATEQAEQEAATNPTEASPEMEKGQTQPDDKTEGTNTYKTTVEAILDHRVRKQRGLELKLLVKWKDSKIQPEWEHIKTMETEQAEALAEYLGGLKSNKSKRLPPLIRTFPHLMKLIK